MYQSDLFDRSVSLHLALRYVHEGVSYCAELTFESGSSDEERAFMRELTAKGVSILYQGSNQEQAEAMVFHRSASGLGKKVLGGPALQALHETVFDILMK